LRASTFDQAGTKKLEALSLMDESAEMKDSESSLQISLDDWGKQLMENILLTAAEELSERDQTSGSIDVTLTFRLTPIISEDQLEVKVTFKRDPTLVTHIPRQF
jgi:hypothetical protein